MVSVLSVGSAASACTLGDTQDTLMETTPPTEVSKLAALRPGDFLPCEDEELKKSFPASVLEMWRIPLLSLCAGLVSTYMTNNPVGLAWPQSTLSPPTSLGKAPPSVHQDNFPARLERSASCKFLLLSAASEMFLTPSQPIHQQLPRSLVHTDSSCQSSARVSTCLSRCRSPTAGHAAGKCQDLLFWLE